MPSIKKIREDLKRLRREREALNPKSISDLPGEGMGSFAEDDPELHEANRNEPEDE